LVAIHQENLEVVVRVKIVATADLHGSLPNVLPDGDVLVIAGDVCPLSNHERQYQARGLRAVFAVWVEVQLTRFNDVLWVAGNHDFVLQDSKKLGPSLPGTYLQDTGMWLDGIRFWGTPWTPTFGKWAFMAEEDVLEGIFSMIPEDTDVLISHGPPRFSCDRTLRTDENVGSLSLRTRIWKTGVRYVVCGHIHEGYGGSATRYATVFNVSLNTVNYNPINAPREIVLSPREG
jgi:Icc-related predicted phosphoesterase